jgi:hypothetical protein
VAASPSAPSTEDAQAARLRTPEDLDEFFADLDRRHGNDASEEDWEIHRTRIERSRSHGLPDDT